MKVDKQILEKEFNKLKQLDRIEFRQRYSLIKTESSLFDNLGLKIGFALFSILAYLSIAIAFLGAYDYGDNWFYTFIGISKPLTLGAIFCMTLFIIDQFYKNFKIKKELIRLIKKYCPKAIKD